jgi:hypothetical protein
MNLVMFRTIILSMSFLAGLVHLSAGPDTGLKECKDRLVLATYASNRFQVSHVICLIRSLRENGGKYRDSEVFIVSTDPDLDLRGLDKMKGVRILDSDMPPEYNSYPLAVKPFAAAQAERLLTRRDVTLTWFDPETIILSPPEGLIVKGRIKAVVQPVFLTNNISLLPGEPLNDFWERIYGKTDVSYGDIPVVKSLIDGKSILAYYNCEIFSVDPAEGICEQWAEIMDDLLSDRTFAYGVCNTDQRKIFLHQAVLSAVIVSKAGKKGTRSLNLKFGYPLNLHERIPPDRQITPLNSISCAIIEDLWERDPSWMNDIMATEPLKSWIEVVSTEYMKANQLR